jgi:hypothetical protein
MNGKAVTPLTVGSIRASIPKTTQGSDLNSFTFQIVDSQGVGVAIVGTLSGSFEREGEGPYLLTGTLIPDADQVTNPGVFVFTPDVVDVQYAGTWTLRFWETVGSNNAYTFGGRWEIQANKSWSDSVAPPPPIPGAEYQLKVPTATEDNFASWDDAGQTKDSGKSGSDYYEQTDFSASPVAAEPLKADGSGGIAFGGKISVNPPSNSTDAVSIVAPDSLGVLFRIENSDRSWGVGLDDAENFVIRDVTGGSLQPIIIQNGAPSDSFRIFNTGRVVVNGASASSQLHINTSSASTIGQIIQGSATQTASLTEWRNSAGTALTRIRADGAIIAPQIFELSGTASFSESATGTDRVAIGVRNGTPRFLLEDNSTIWQVDNNNGAFRFFTPGIINMQIDTSSTAGDTRLLIYDVDNATLERVSVGAADSGGAGYKVLRIPN